LSNIVGRNTTHNQLCCYIEELFFGKCEARQHPFSYRLLLPSSAITTTSGCSNYIKKKNLKFCL